MIQTLTELETNMTWHEWDPFERACETVSGAQHHSRGCQAEQDRAIPVNIAHSRLWHSETLTLQWQFAKWSSDHRHVDRVHTTGDHWGKYSSLTLRTVFNPSQWSRCWETPTSSSIWRSHPFFIMETPSPPLPNEDPVENYPRSCSIFMPNQSLPLTLKRGRRHLSCLSWDVMWILHFPKCLYRAVQKAQDWWDKEADSLPRKPESSSYDTDSRVTH